MLKHIIGQTIYQVTVILILVFSGLLLFNYFLLNL